MNDNSSYEAELQKKIEDQMKLEKENSIPIYKKINFVASLTFLVGMIAFSLLLWEILPTSLDYDHYFKRYVNMFHLKYVIIALPYLGLITALILFMKKKKALWLLTFSLFSILYPFNIHAKKYINQHFNTNISEQPQSDLTPLYFAVQMNQADKVKTLLEYGANPNESYTYKENSIYVAIHNNNLEIAKLLIAHGAKVDRLNYMNGTPLHLAVSKNNLDLIKLLLESEASVNVQTRYHEYKRPALTTLKDFGKTPLHVAVQNNSYKITSLLLEYGANPSIKDNDDKNVFAYAHGKDIMNLLKQNNKSMN